MVRSGQIGKQNLRSVAIPRPLAMAMMLAGMTGDHQRLAWSILACCADPKVKLKPVGDGDGMRLAYTIDKNALMLRAGNRMYNANRDLQAIVEKAMMRSMDAKLDERPLFRRIDYQPGVRKMRGGKIIVELGDEALGLMSKTDVVRVPVDLWRGINRQVAFALMVFHYAELALALEDAMPRPERSNWPFTKDQLGWWSKAKCMTLGRFTADYLTPALGDLNGDASLIHHRLVKKPGGVTAHARAKVVASIKYQVETDANGEVRETLNRHVSARWNTIDVDARKDMRQAAMRADFGVRKRGKQTTDILRAEVRPKVEAAVRAELKAELRAEVMAELRAELGERVAREGVGFLAPSKPAPVAATTTQAMPRRSPASNR